MIDFDRMREETPLEFYRRYYAGIGQFRLKRVDPDLYENLERRGLLRKIPDETTLSKDGVTETQKKVDEAESKFLLKRYNSKFAGLTTKELMIADPALFKRMNDRNLLEEHVRGRRDFGDPLQFYRNYYNGLTSGELSKIDPELWDALRAEDLLHNIPGHKPKSRRDFGGDLVEYYKTHYPGVTRKKLSKLDKTLYNRLQERGLLHHVPNASEKK